MRHIKQGTDNTTFVSINLSPELRDRLSKLAQNCGTSRAKMCRLIFEDYMRVYEKRHGQI